MGKNKSQHRRRVEVMCSLKKTTNKHDKKQLPNDQNAKNIKSKEERKEKA